MIVSEWCEKYGTETGPTADQIQATRRLLKDPIMRSLFEDHTVPYSQDALEFLEDTAALSLPTDPAPDMISAQYEAWTSEMGTALSRMVFNQPTPPPWSELAPSEKTQVSDFLMDRIALDDMQMGGL